MCPFHFWSVQLLPKKGSDCTSNSERMMEFVDYAFHLFLYSLSTKILPAYMALWFKCLLFRGGCLANSNNQTIIVKAKVALVCKLYLFVCLYISRISQKDEYTKMELYEKRRNYDLV